MRPRGYSQWHAVSQAEKRREMKAAIEKLQSLDPAKYAELLKRAQDDNYDARVRREEMEKHQRELEEIRQRVELERMRVLSCPVIAGLPDIDMSRVHGIVAFRVWHYDNWGLKSTAMRYHWKELNFADVVPNDHNQGGFYSIKLTGLSVLTSGASYFDTGLNDVSGFVELRGHVVEHDDGILRSEVARLLCLFVTSDNDNIGNIVKRLCVLYPTTPVFVLNPEQLADVVMREVLRQRYLGGEF